MSVPTGGGQPPINNAPAYTAPGGGYGPAAGRVDFGWLGQGWALFTARPGVWVGAMALFFLIGAALWVAWAVPTGVINTLRQMYAAIVGQNPGLMPRGNPVKDFALNHVFAILAGGVNAVFFGGLYRTALRQMRGEPVSALGLFSGFGQAGPLLAVGIVVPAALGLIEGLLFWLLRLAHAPAAGVVSALGLLMLLPGLAAQALLMFAPLRVVDRGEGAADALLGSVRLLRGQWLMGTLFYIVASLIGGLGAAVCGVGMLASYPLFLLSVAAGYRSLTQPPPSAPAYPYTPAAPGVWPPPPTS
jgi:uncharacterized membrane protein